MPNLNFLKAKETYAENTPIQTQMRYKLLELLQSTQRTYFAKIFEFGSGLGDFTNMLIKQLTFKEYYSNDYYDYGISPIDSRISLNHFDMRELESSSIYTQRFDLIASNACIQWLDVSHTLFMLSKILNDNGILLLSTFGEHNLKEIKQITGYGLEYLSLESLKYIICNNFELLSLEEKHYSLQFSNALEVFRHLKKSGVNSLGCAYLKKSWLQDYEQKFCNKLSYHCIFILARRI